LYGEHFHNDYSFVVPRRCGQYVSLLGVDWAKKLRWQTELEKVGFELGEIGSRITTEAKPECPMLAPGCEGAAQRLPAPDIFGSEIVGYEGLYPRRCGSDQPD